MIESFQDLYETKRIKLITYLLGMVFNWHLAGL